MNTGGWIFFGLFWGMVICLNIFCYTLILKHKHKHGRE